MKKCLSMLLATLLLLACIPLSASAACGIAGHRVTEPTCTEEGICRDCGITYAALGHQYNESGICEYCGEKKDRGIARYFAVRNRLRDAVRTIRGKTKTR